MLGYYLLIYLDIVECDVVLLICSRLRLYSYSLSNWSTYTSNADISLSKEKGDLEELTRLHVKWLRGLHQSLFGTVRFCQYVP